MNALDLLKSDHAKVETLFEQIQSTGESEHPAIFAQIKNELETHAHLEETLFYPSLQEDGSEALVQLTSEAIQEHQQMKAFLGELTVSQTDAQKFEPLLSKLIEDVRNHVEEEEDIMFPQVKDEFDAATIDRWGAQMEAEKASFMSSSESVHA